MAIQNTEIKYKVIIEGVTAFRRGFGCSEITEGFDEGELITGQSSNATAIVSEAVSTGTQELYCENVDGKFLEKEIIIGETGETGYKRTGWRQDENNYTNLEYGIDDGVWTFDTDGGLVYKLKNAVQKINISKGGNLASGYQFGFSIKNQDFLKSMKTDGVFFNNLKCQLQIEVNGTYETEWTGIVETFKFSDETTVEVQCTDLTKSMVENIGSDSIPITVNRNYNCKLVENGKGITETYDMQWYKGKSSNMWPARTTSSPTDDIDDGPWTMTVRSNVDRQRSHITNEDLRDTNFNNALIEVVYGPDAGTFYKIVTTQGEVKKPDTSEAYWEWIFTVDRSNSGIVPTNNQWQTNNPSILRIVSNKATYALSQKEPHFIYRGVQSQKSKQLSVIDSGFEYPLAEGRNWNTYTNTTIGGIDSYFGVTLEGLDDNKGIQIFSEYLTPIPDTNLVASSVKNTSEDWNGDNRVIVTVEQTLDPTAIDILDDIYSKGSDTFISPTKFTIRDLYDPNSPIDPYFEPFRPVAGTRPQANVYFEAKVELKDEIWLYGQSYLIPENTPVPLTQWEGATDEQSRQRQEVVCLNDRDLEVDVTKSWTLDREAFQLSDYNKSDPILSITLITTIEFPGASLVGGENPSNVVIDDCTISYGGDQSVDNVSIGCQGENVSSFGKVFESVPKTVEYLLENYMGIDSDQINDASFAVAEEDTNLFPSYSDQNLAHQITENQDSTSILKEICYSSHMGLFIDRAGQYRMESWLPKSTVFSDTTTPFIFTEENSESISKITRDNYNNVITDIEVQTHLGEFDDEYDNTIRIKGTEFEEGDSTYDINSDSEGLTEIDNGSATEAFNMLALGWKRGRKVNQLKVENKWFKSENSDGSGNSDTINWIRNISGHVNREHEYLDLTVPLTRANLDLELLQFVIVKDQFITDNVYRKSWIVQRTVNTTDHVIVWKLLLDIDPNDPFFYQIDALQDTHDPIDGVIVDDQASLDILQDGGGK